MSVGFSFRVDIRPYSGFSDPGLPIASWISQAGAVGDASGGTINLDFQFQLDLQPLISEMFNLEQISIDTTSSTSRDAALQTINMDNLAQNRAGSTQMWMLQSRGSSALGISALNGDDLPFLPLWLGSPNRDEGDSGLRLLMPNILNLLYAATLQGYMWGPRSVLTDGGPRRPVAGGLFGP